MVCLIIAVIYCKVERRRNRKTRGVRRTSWYLENPTYYLGTSGASGLTDSLPLPNYQSYRESMDIQNANRQAGGLRSWLIGVVMQGGIRVAHSGGTVSGGAGGVDRVG